MDATAGDVKLTVLESVPVERAESIEPASKRSILTGVRSDRVLWRFLLALLAIFLIKQLLMVVIFPPFTGHDEVAHFAYVQTVATEHRVPELLVDDIPDYFYRYCLYILDWSPCDPDDPRWLQQPFRFADWGVAGVHPAGQQYTANHPPLYYLIAAPLYRITESASYETQQYVLRVLAIPFGLLTVLLAFLTAVLVFPGNRFVAIVASTFVAFQPQVSYESSMVNHDIAGIAVVSLMLYLLVRGMRDRFPLFETLALGFALGVALLIKSNSMVIAPVIALAMILSIGWRNVAEWVGKGALVVAAAGLLSAPWYVFLYRTYGNFDALDQIEEMQEPWNQPVGSIKEQLFNRGFIWERWREAWGAFGWRRIQLTDWLLWLIAIPIIIALVGLVLYWVRSIGQRRSRNLLSWLPGFERPDRLQAWTVVVFVALFVVSYLAIIEFGTRFALTQARYLFPTVNAVAILLALGLQTLTPIRFRPFVQGATVSGLVLLNLIIYTKFVIPYWHLTDWTT